MVTLTNVFQRHSLAWDNRKDQVHIKLVVGRSHHYGQAKDIHKLDVGLIYTGMDLGTMGRSLTEE